MNNFQKQLADLQAQFMMNAFGVNPPIVVNPVVIAPIIAPIPEPIYYPTVYYQLYNEENFISYNDDEILIIPSKKEELELFISNRPIIIIYNFTPNLTDSKVIYLIPTSLKQIKTVFNINNAPSGKYYDVSNTITKTFIL